MALLIQTTGLEEYAPGGTARVKVLNIGGPGVGKTRWASYFPQPIFADCERGLASVADRNVPFVNIETSQDMLDLLAYLKQECRQPAAQRRYHTVVIDTLDAFQRKIKNEWMEREKKQTFAGWEAWGFLDSRLQLLMTRLLNLDMNVIVNVHYKDKKTKDDETGKESHELMLQLQGDLANTAFNDFDLVGWTGVYWEAIDGERIQKRGITFKPTPDKPFLKDRLHVTPPWLEIDFAPTDYEALFSRIQARVDQLTGGEVIGEVPPETAELAKPGALVVPPGAAGSGAMPPSAPRAVPYISMDKITLAKLARDRNITTTIDGQPIKGNTLKAELIAALDHADLKQEKNGAPPAATPAPAASPAQQPPAGPGAQPQNPRPVAVSANVANPGRAQVKDLPDIGTVNTKTGEILSPPTHEQAVETVQDVLGGTVIGSIDEPAESPAPEPAAPPAPPVPPAAAAPAAPKEVPVCEVCAKDLTAENPDFVRLAWIKYRKRLCGEHYAEKKAGR